MPSSHAAPPPVSDDGADPLDRFAARADETGAVLLYSCGPGATDGWALEGGAPQRIVSGQIGEAAIRKAAFETPPGPALGLWGYELGGLVEAVPDTPRPQQAWPDFWRADLDAIRRFAPGTPTAPAARAPARSVRAMQGRQSYEAKVARAIRYIRAGDIFQVNLSQAFEAELDAGDTPFAAFRRLVADSPAPYALYARLSPDMALISNSPELFLSVTADGEVETRPIKGTIARGRDAQEDAANARALTESEKDRAENLMIVDLMRNDLARVCAAGSVRVPAMFEIESYANVHHLVSTVRGRLRPGESAASQLRVAFPPGSVTGAPKPRALEIIAELEGEARGPYCGAFGVFDGSGAGLFNVLIRSVAFVREGGRWRARFRSGGAVVADSDPGAEYAETIAKAASILKALGAEPPS